MMTARAALTMGLVTAVMSLAGQASATISQATIASPGGFMQVGATTVGESFTTALGDDLEFVYMGSGDVFDEAQFGGIGSAARSISTSFSGGSANAIGSVNLGQIKVASSSASTAFGFVKGEAHGGFKDSLTISNAALDGQAGFHVFTIGVTGTLTATGISGRAYAEIGAFKDGVRTLVNQYHDDGQSNNLFATGFQQGFWEASTATTNGFDQFIVNDTITFAVPIVFGQEFELGLYARAAGDKRSSLNDSNGSTADALFQNTFTWTGTQSVLLADGTVVSDYDLVSASGLDYRGLVPAPGTLALAAVGGLVAARRRR